MEEPRIGDRRKDQTGVEWIYAGKAGWRRVVEPENKIDDKYKQGYVKALEDAAQVCESLIGTRAYAWHCADAIRYLIKEKTNE